MLHNEPPASAQTRSKMAFLALFAGFAMNTYLLLKHLHINCASLSIAGFALRGYWMLSASPLLHSRVTRILPHIIDTLLLASAIGMLLLMDASPFALPWLAAKIGGLLAYIGLGSVALKYGKTRQTRAIAFVAALLCVGWIVSVAVLKSPAGILGLWLA